MSHVALIFDFYRKANLQIIIRDRYIDDKNITFQLKVFVGFSIIS